MVVDARSYRSPLREEQAEATRQRILDATLRSMASGVATLSVPAVARAAGVSVPTVYRHFRTKRELLAALYPYVAARSGLDRRPDPRTLAELRDTVRAIFRQLDSLDDLARVAIASPGAEEARRATMDDRLERIRRFTDGLDAPLDPAGRERVARLLLILTSSAALRLWRDHLGASVDDAADDVDWLVRAAISAAADEAM